MTNNLNIIGANLIAEISDNEDESSSLLFSEPMPPIESCSDLEGIQSVKACGRFWLQELHCKNRSAAWNILNTIHQRLTTSE